MKKTKVFLSFVLIGLLAVSAAIIPLQAAIPAEERAALIAFYNAASGDNWLYNWRWKTPPLHTDGFAMPGTEKDWYGIEVLDNHVASIYLFSNLLNGSIPPELGNLSKLEWLGLNYNDLNGGIPPELGNLSKLRELWMSDNQLSGSIPPELGNLGNLEYLDLYSNLLSGSIPPELGNLSNLVEMYLGDNQLRSSIPPEVGNLSNLLILNLGENQLIDIIPSELGNLSNLDHLILRSNQLTGNIPTSLSNLNKLGDIDISHNCLYTNDLDLKAWLNGFDPDWESYQCEEEKDPPFGSFETPIDGSTVCSSIPVTGWALDDLGKKGQVDYFPTDK
ncbi:leucine-rich repeat domain-containing protein [Acidobacteriota bacterium]